MEYSIQITPTLDMTSIEKLNDFSAKMQISLSVLLPMMVRIYDYFQHREPDALISVVFKQSYDPSEEKKKFGIRLSGERDNGKFHRLCELLLLTQSQMVKQCIELFQEVEDQTGFKPGAPFTIGETTVHLFI